MSAEEPTADATAAPEPSVFAGGPFTPASGRQAAYRGLAKLSDAELSESRRQIANARWDKYRADRIARGLPPSSDKRKRRPTLDGDDLAVWIDEVRNQFPDEAAAMSDGELKHRANFLARQAAADAAARAASVPMEATS